MEPNILLCSVGDARVRRQILILIYNSLVHMVRTKQDKRFDFWFSADPKGLVITVFTVSSRLVKGLGGALCPCLHPFALS
ncbi:hypothetical protein [Parachlamydia sp. AcF125]|uniref:hypothetical protein n=1 Tax=Parachlamydia sp. AcF125 TaxID=2795736 RepID=UPI001BC95F19|nr:hypothetical protein [Parachlamydia sp. AcF125]